MRKIIVLFFILTISAGAFAQGDLDKVFYLRFGYSKPAKAYWGIDEKEFWEDYDIKRNGINFELGQIFMFNSLPLADGLRLGLNADYLSFYYHGLKDSNDKIGHILIGSKIGPSLSYSPVDKLVFDTYFKFNIVWVSTLFDGSVGDETNFYLGTLGVGYSFGINVRYSVLMLGVDFNKSWNKLNYIDSDDGLQDDRYWGNWGNDSGDDTKEKTPMPSVNFTIGLAF